ncbi:hypothetical protein F5Y03DRAFT_187559 [Xylaria venustula]|nr:hypothetical protein F5Y03DRAFT_187559 [Xylaria venustula]
MTRRGSVVVRLILVVGISGVDEQSRKQVSGQIDQIPAPLTNAFSFHADKSTHSKQTSGIPGTAIPPSEDQDYRAPVLTRSRTARVRDTHPIRGHASYLPEPETLSYVAEATQLDSEILLRHLDQQEHLIYRRQLQQPRREKGGSREQLFDISLGIDQENYITAISRSEPSLGKGKSQTEKGDLSHTVVLLVNEDNCLGIDFNTYASALDQVFQSSFAPPNEAFETVLRSKDEYERALVLENPLSLVWDYATLISTKFTSQLELYRRKWKILYEKHANTTAVYGNPEIRDIIRKEAIQLSTHIQYVQRSLQRLEKITPKTRRKSSRPAGSVLDELIQDFQDISDRLESLKSAYDKFIEQQVEKVSLAEARESMTEARDLQRLSYLGFVFAPLSLACSFFSTDIQPLDGPAPVWQLAVTSLAILFFSLLVLYLLIALNNNRPKLSFPSTFFKRDRGYNPPKVNEPEKTPSLADSPNNSEGLTGKSAVTEQTVHAGHVPKGSGTKVTQKPRIQASQGARPRIPMNDSERRQAYSDGLTRTAAHKPPPREEFPDSPKLDLSRLDDSTFLQYPIQHRPARKRPEVTVTATTELTTDLSIAENPSQVVEPAGLSNETANLVVSDDGIKTIVTARIKYRDGVEEKADEKQKFDRHDDSAHANNMASGSDLGVRHDHGNSSSEAGPGCRPSSPSRLSSHNSGDEDQSTDPENQDYDDGDNDDEDGNYTDDNDGRSFESSIAAGSEEVVFSIPESVESLPAPYKKPEFSEWDSAIADADDYAITNFSLDRPLGQWQPDAEEVMIAKAFSDLCKKNDLHRIKVLIAEFRKQKSNLNIDGLYAWGLAEAARLLLLDAMPLFFNAIKHPDTRADGLDYALQKAIGDSEEHLATMRWLGRRGVRMNIAKVDREDPLTIACEGGYEKAVQLLLDWGADPNLRLDSFVGISESWPLRRALKENHTGIARLLLRNGAHGTDPKVVQAAAKSGSLDILEALVAAGGAVVDLDGQLAHAELTDPFCLAAEGAHLHVMKYILDLGILLDETLGEKTRGIHAFDNAVWAARQDSEAICLMLLDLGVELSFSRPPYGGEYSIAHISYTFASLGGMTTLLKRILDTGADPNAVVITSGTVNYWLKAVGNGINPEDCSYGSMLAVACAAGHLDAALLLIQRGANVHYGGCSSNTNMTPLHIAARNNRVNAVELLLNYGAKVDARAPESGAMPIHDAAGAGSTACIEYLLHHGATLESLDNTGQTPLIVAAREGKLEAVEKLLDEGAAVSASDGEGWTAAHRAAWNGHERIVKLLFERNADPAVETDSGLRVEELLNHAEEKPRVDDNYQGESE